MPIITKVTGYCSKKKGRYWICWREDGQQKQKDFASSALAIAFAKGLAIAAAEQVTSDEEFFQLPEGPLYELVCIENDKVIATLQGGIGRNLYDAGVHWRNQQKGRQFEIRRCEDQAVIIKTERFVQ